MIISSSTELLPCLSPLNELPSPLTVNGGSADGMDFEVDNQIEESPSSNMPYTAQVRRECIPIIGQEFVSLEDVYTFYNNYAKEAGFSVRAHSSKVNRENEVIRKEYVCYKQGGRATSSQGNKRRCGKIREGCKAKISVVRSRLGTQYIISQVVEGHNHTLATPRKTTLLRSHRGISSAQKSLHQQLGIANVPTYQQIAILGLQAGGLQNIGCTEQDLYNYERDERKEYAGHDGTMLYEYFQSEQKKNPGFTFAIKSDKDDRITHCFWVDATSRRSYQFFGDVVVFDTTYNTNRYAMIFAPILGVNNHGQTTLFGCAFLSDETAESFVWLFEEWLKAMPAIPPKMIITDQDLGMSKAIANVLPPPSTFHRYCMWHILNKFSEKIDAVSYAEYFSEFQKTIWDSESPKEFEVNWVSVVQKSSLCNNEWLQGIYQIRSKWVPAYVNDKLSANMRSSQRAESSHAFYKKFVSKNNSLMDFMIRFERALSQQRRKELMFDHKDIDEKPVTKTLWLLEKEMSGIYTRNIFYKFQEQLWFSMMYAMRVEFEDDGQCVYTVQIADGSSSRVRKIVVDKTLDYVSCSCRHFESAGIPCRHMLAYFDKTIKLPDKYIVPRWIKSAKSYNVLDDLGVEVKDVTDKSLLTRRNNLFQLASTIIDDALMSEEASEVVREDLELLIAKIKSMTINEREGVATQNVTPTEIIFKEPLRVRAKGCGKRLKGGKEKAKENKSRRCHGCGLIASHDKRNCPKLNNISFKYGNSGNEHVDVHLNDDDDDDDDDAE